jgi:pimeloyl-ACP methyl ester carboxylesterase
MWQRLYDCVKTGELLLRAFSQEDHRDVAWATFFLIGGHLGLCYAHGHCVSSTAVGVTFVIITVLLGTSRSGSDQRDYFCALNVAFGRYRGDDTPEAQPKDGGKFAPLSHGATYYIIDGQDQPGPLVVLVHGFVGSSAYFKWLSDELVAGGRRVLRYDLMGRGRSEFDGSPQTEKAFSAQLVELLYSLGADYGANEQIDLLGYSMGGAIAAKFAATYPEKLRSLVLVAPVGTHELSLPALSFPFLRVPVIPALVVRMIVSASSLVDKSEWESPGLPGILIGTMHFPIMLRFLATNRSQNVCGLKMVNCDPDSYPPHSRFDWPRNRFALA